MITSFGFELLMHRKSNKWASLATLPPGFTEIIR